MNEQRGHVDVVGGDIEIELLHRVEVRVVLLGDEGDGDVVDIDFVLLDEMQQEIERSVKRRQRDFVRVRFFFIEFVGHHRHRNSR